MNSLVSDYNSAYFKSKLVAGEVYTDISYTFIHPATGNLLLSSDLEAIKNSIKNIVLTPKGSRPFNPEFGSRVGNLLFENASPLITIAMRSEIFKVISKYERRVKDVVVDVSDDNDDNTYNISISFTAQYDTQVEFSFKLNRIR